MPPISIVQSIADAAAHEVARDKPLTSGEESQNGAEVADEENEQSGDSVGLNAEGFVRVCLQLMRDNFLAKVGITQWRVFEG